METDKNPQLSIEEDGNRRWLVATEDGITARVRLPLHVDKMNDAQKEFFMHNACIELKQKILKDKALGNVTN